MASTKPILIVDDDPDIRQLLAMTLDGEGFAVKQAEHGRRGIQLLTGFTPSLIILDMMMPEMNGLEFCQQLVKFKVTGIPVLIVSAVSERASFMRQFFELPIENKAFINKPFEPKALVAKVREMLAGGPPKPADEPAPEPTAEAEPEAPAPVETPPPPPSTPPPPRASRKGRLRILVIDDDDDIRKFLELALGEKFEVRVAENGMAGLQSLDRFNPDLVLCDIFMPVLDGFKTVASIREHPRFHDIPVFFLSADERKELPQMALDGGANLFLPKPINATRLIALIERFVEEVGLHPGLPPAATPPPSPRGGGGAGALPRILVIDSNVANTSLLKDILGVGVGRHWESLWSEEPRAALGNLQRWEPDVILYNPRQKVMEGIEFAQALLLNKLLKEYSMAFIGNDFLDSDREFSRQRFGREVIALDRPRPEIDRALFDAIRAAKPKAKRMTIDQLRAEDRTTESLQVADQEKLRKQREFLREKYRRMQQVIDEK